MSLIEWTVTMSGETMVIAASLLIAFALALKCLRDELKDRRTQDVINNSNQKKGEKA